VHSPKEPACERLLDVCCGSGIQVCPEQNQTLKSKHQTLDTISRARSVPFGMCTHHHPLIARHVRAGDRGCRYVRRARDMRRLEPACREIHPLQRGDEWVGGTRQCPAGGPFRPGDWGGRRFWGEVGRYFGEPTIHPRASDAQVLLLSPRIHLWKHASNNAHYAHPTTGPRASIYGPERDTTLFAQATRPLIDWHASIYRSKRYDLFADGGNDGEDVLRRVVSEGMRLLR
jgi:hypothetical protein